MTIDVVVLKHNTTETEVGDEFKVLFKGFEGDVEIRISLKAPEPSLFIRYPLGSMHSVGISKTGQKQLGETGT
jgi:hypothetical protein